MNSGRVSAAGRSALILLLFLITAVYALWPLGTSPCPHDHADTLFNSWLIRWNIHAVVEAGNPLELPIFSGFTDGQGRNDLLLTQSAAALPFYLAGADPVLSHNLLMLLSLFLAGIAAYLLALETGTERWGAVFTGVAVILLPWFQSHLWHVQLFSGGLGLLAVTFALRTAKRQSSGWQLALFVLLQCLASLYMWFFMNLAILLLLPFLFTEKYRRGAFRTSAWFAAGNAACLPFLLNHLSHAGRWSADTVASTDLSAFLAPWENSVLLGWMRSGLIHPEAALWPGLAVTAGFAWFMLKPGKKEIDWYLLSCAVVFAVLALGPTLVVFGHQLAPAPFRLIAELPGASSIRLPARGAFFALVPMAVLAGRILGRKQALAAAGMLLAAAGIFHPPLETIPLEQRPWQDWLEESNFSRVLYLPVSWDMARPETETLRLIGSTSHFTPSLNGYSTTLPDGYRETAEILNGWPSSEARSMAENFGIECVIVENRSVQQADTVFESGGLRASAILLEAGSRN